MTKRVTIKDVAKKAGFSVTTVSFVLNNKENNISQATKDIITKAASDLGYRPNQLAVALITKKTGVLGLIIPDISNPFFAELAKEIGLTAQEHGYTIIFGETDNEPKALDKLLNMFIDRQVDGVVLTKSTRLSISEELRHLEYLKSNGIPAVSIDSNIDSENINSVILDHSTGGYLATKHLIELGHTRIGCYTGPKGVQTSEERIAGYKRALKEKGITFNKQLLFEGDYSLGTDNALKHFLEKQVTGIFALNDMMALGLYKSANHLRVQIPKDISIVGFDDVYLSEIVHPTLTTIHQPNSDIAYHAINILLERINKDDDQQAKADIGSKVFLEPTLMLRESTKRVRREGNQG